MRLVNKIRTLMLAVTLSAACNSAHAQYNIPYNLARFDHKFTIGFEKAVYSIYAPREVKLSDKTLRAEERCNTIVFRVRLTTRFRIETGLSFKDIDRMLNTRYEKAFNPNQSLKLSVPVTLQYQFGSPQHRIRPYIGGGLLFNPLISDNGSSPFNADAAGMYNTNNLRYMNIIFTQGIIYNINPNLQLSHSIHIMPENGFRPIGFNIGVGYRIK